MVIIWNVDIKKVQKKSSKKIQTFYNLKEYTISLVKELMYIDDIENNYLQNEIDYSTFDQEEFDNVKICKYCKCEFNHPYIDRYIILGGPTPFLPIPKS